MADWGAYERVRRAWDQTLAAAMLRLAHAGWPRERVVLALDVVGGGTLYVGGVPVYRQRFVASALGVEVVGEWLVDELPQS